MILLDSGQGSEGSEDEHDITQEITQDQECAISYHAMSGDLVPQTLRFQGIIGSQCVSVLLDTGSTHNFIQSRIARAVGLPIIKTSTF